MFLPLIQRAMPARVKNALKPYYRTFFPNRLHVLLWVTFRCNYRCSYCPVVTKVDYTDFFPPDQERTPDEWITGLQKLPPALIYISGGEPFVYKDLPRLVNGLGKHALLGIVTNATAPLKVYDRIERPIHLNISFHREFTDEAAFAAKVLALGRRHQVQVNIVATPENLPFLARIAQDFRAQRIDLHVDPFVDPGFRYTPDQRRVLDGLLQSDRAVHVEHQQDFADYTLKACSAGRNYINVMPNGEVYTCVAGVHFQHSPLLRPVLAAAPRQVDLDAFRLGNLFAEDFALRTDPVLCGLPCTNACDFDAVQIARV